MLHGGMLLDSRYIGKPRGRMPSDDGLTALTCSWKLSGAVMVSRGGEAMLQLLAKKAELSEWWGEVNWAQVICRMKPRQRTICKKYVEMNKEIGSGLQCIRPWQKQQNGPSLGRPLLCGAGARKRQGRLPETASSARRMEHLASQDLV